jgi:enoyl-CoA hydratase
MTDTKHVAVEQANHIATITIQRAEKLNALNVALVAELTRTFQRLAAADGADAVRVAILTGAGKAFVAGADISEMAQMTTLEALQFSEAGHRLCAAIEDAPFAVIAAVNGFALGGGCELALACDFIIAAEEAKIGQPEVTLGVIPGFGGTQRLTRQVGNARARELVFTGDVLGAPQALAIGLVSTVVPGGELMPRALDIAKKIAARGPAAVTAAKRVMVRGQSLDLPVACELERQAFAALFGTDDQRAGMRAFLDKAKPSFTGK